MIAKVVTNQVQMTCINLKQKIDIMKAKSVAEHQLLSQFVLEIHNPVLPQVKMILITQNNKYLKVFHRVKPPCGSYKTVYKNLGGYSNFN